MDKILDFLKILDIEDKKEQIKGLHKILDPGPFYHSCYLKIYEEDYYYEHDGTCHYGSLVKLDEEDRYYCCSKCNEAWDRDRDRDKSKNEIEKIGGCISIFPIYDFFHKLPEKAYEKKKESDPKLFVQALNIICYYQNTNKENWDNIIWEEIDYPNNDQETNLLFYWYVEQEPIVTILAHYIAEKLKI